MEIVNAANQWAKAEVVSSYIFMLFGISYLLASYAFGKWGNTELTKALVIPILVAGGLLLMAGIGFYFSNNTKLKNFESDYQKNPTEFVKSEIGRTEQTIKTYKNVALKVFPLFIGIALLCVVFLLNSLVKAICIAVAAFFFVLVLLDSQALKRMEHYHDKLVLTEKVLRDQ